MPRHGSSAVCVLQLRKAAQASVVSMLKEGTPTGEVHPAASSTAKHCSYVMMQGGEGRSAVPACVQFDLVCVVQVWRRPGSTCWAC